MIGGSFSVQVSSGCWCGKQGSVFHSSANVTPFFCSSASVRSRHLNDQGNLSRI